MMKRYTLILFAVLLLVVPAALHAQIAAYGTVGGAAFGNAPVNLGYGGMVGVYKASGHVLHTVSVGGDLRGSFMGRDGFHFNTFAVGPRVSFNPHVIPLHPYVEGLIGLGNYNRGKNTSSSNHFNYQVVGGLDATILPRIDWRVVDIAYSAVTSNSVRTTTFSTGLVVRLW